MIFERPGTRIFTTFCLLLCMITAFGQQVENAIPLKSAPAATSHLPLLLIDTQGQTIPNDPKITVNIKVIDNGSGKSNSTSDPGNQYDGLAGIEIRGQSSQMFPKKGYGLELRDSQGKDLKAGLMGLPSESDWVLYAPYSDKTMLRNALTYYLGRRMGNWQPGFRFCELYLNGNYMGIYQLTEKIKKDQERLDIADLNPDEISGDDVTGGYILKVDKLGGLNSSEYFYNYPDVRYKNARNYAWTWYYPEPEDLVKEQRSYFMNFIKTAENAINGNNFTDPVSGYTKYIDVPTFIDFQIMNELGNNVDGYRYSTFFHKDKDSKGGKLKAGPLWDFDLCYGNLDYSYQHQSTELWSYTNWGTSEGNCMHWWYRFMEDPQYEKAIKARWAELRKGAFANDSIMSFIDSHVLWLGGAINRNYAKWNILGSYVWPNSAIRYNYPSEIDYLKYWISNRLTFMDKSWLGVPAGEDTIPVIDRINIWPNPVSDMLTIDLPESGQFYIVELYDIRGTLIISKSLMGLQAARHKMNLQGLGGGLYLLTVRRPGMAPVTLKILKHN